MSKVIYYVEDVMELLMYKSQTRKLTDKEKYIFRGLNEWMKNDDEYTEAYQ